MEANETGIYQRFWDWQEGRLISEMCWHRPNSIMMEMNANTLLLSTTFVYVAD